MEKKFLLNYELQDYHIQLRNLSQHLQVAREAECVRIARDLHDDLGQVLTALKIDIVLLHKRLIKLESSLNLGNYLSNRTIEMQRKANATINTVRRISANLRPSILDDLGLLAAIE